MEFSIRLKELRESKGLSQAELAEVVGVGVSTVGMWESTKRIPRAKTLDRLLSFFHCSLDYLLGKTDRIEPSISGELQIGEEEREILACYQSLRPDLKEAFWISLRAMSSASAEQTVPKKKA